MSGEKQSIISDWFQFFKDLVIGRIGVPFVAGIYRQYIQQCLQSSKFKVVTYRLEAISDLYHLNQFITKHNLAELPNFDRKEALKCLIQCSGNPRTIVRTIEHFLKYKKWRVSPERSVSNIGSNYPLIQALGVAGLPLALSPDISTCDSDQICTNSGNISVDFFDVVSFCPSSSHFQFKYCQFHTISLYFVNL
ncbi:hypothetical protein P9112_007023 [Eukaryota sp. TZLM1-RC]